MNPPRPPKPLGPPFFLGDPWPVAMLSGALSSRPSPYGPQAAPFGTQTSADTRRRVFGRHGGVDWAC
eukprot:7696915-Alexandrium_andersonii.AAC.1